MPRSTVIIAALMLIPAAAAAQAGAAPAAGSVDSARAAVRNLVEREQLPGLAITVSDGSEIIWHEGFGFADQAAGLAATPATRFRIGSISKLLTATALARLARAGAVDLDAPLAAYDSTLPAHLGVLTLRQLAGHLGGVRHYRGGEFFSRASCRSLKDGLSVFAGDSLVAPPGTRYAYSTYGFNLIGAVLEAAVGRPFPEIVRNQVGAPLALRATVPDSGGERQPGRARLYAVGDSGVTAAPVDDLSCRWPSGGYLSSTDDLAKLGSAMLAPGLLDSTSLAVMLTPQRTAAGEATSVGIGWRVSHDSAGRRYLHHGGSSNGGSAFLLVYPEERLVVAMAANAFARWGERDALEIARIFLDPATTLVELPVRYAEDRYFVTPVLETGDTLLLYTDTGGGTNMLWPATVDRLGLEAEWLRQGSDSARLVTLPAMVPDASIPLPAAPPPLGSAFLVIPPQHLSEGDGFLGRTWFADRVWLFDYPGRSLAQVESGAGSFAPAHRAPLGFQTDSAGRRTTHFPRITAVVDGDSLDLLFDTGATVSLSAAALAALGDGGPAQRGTSFITEAVFQEWRAAHPDWRVVDSADMLAGAPMIEVPRVSIAGHEVGPVWFTMRPDRAFHEWMAQWMDRPLDGALGGSALRYFRVLVNYPKAYAAFELAQTGEPSQRHGH